MKQKGRLLSLVLCLVMALGVLPTDMVQVQAAETVSETEDNNSRDTANVIDVNTTVAGTITDYDDEDWYKFTLPSDGYFTYDLTSVSGGKTLTLFEYTLSEIISESDSSIHSRRFNVPKGYTCYVRVKARQGIFYGNACGDYNLTINFTPTTDWELENNGSRKTADKLTKKMKGTMMSSIDEDWFKYTASGNGYVRFKFVNEDSVVTSSGWTITVYDNNLSELVSQNVMSDAMTGTFTVKAKTVLYIKITGSSMVDNLYSIAPVFKSTEYVEKESNNSFKKATKIKSGKKYLGVLNYSEDVDYYKFVAPSTGTYKISFECVDEVSYGYDVTIYGPTKKEIKKLSDLTDDKSAKVKMKKGKTYYIQVADGTSSGSNWVAKYKIKVSKVK